MATSSSALHIRGRGFQEGYQRIAAPQAGALRWQTVGRLGVAAGRAYAAATGGDEVVLALLDGAVTLETDGRTETVSRNGADFADGPTYLCLAPATSYRLIAQTPTTDLLVVQAPAPAHTDTQGGAVRPADAPVRRVGAANWTRDVWPGTSLSPFTQRLLVGETLNPPGGWSSYPPHKHDEVAPPTEAVYEEVYFFQFKPTGGFGFQRIYTRAGDALDEAFVVQDGDTIIIPRGYHPVVAAPGYQMRYVWSLCGEPSGAKRYGAWSDDPDHVWVRAVEAMLAAR
ncbi:MAG TPA: 5-deoxy-glucuronate isomerase [Ktedonobacterales bacterium]|nr:5-deoxy-glucuronate isomerase [Ktedonobacterales bacterium]